MQTNLDIQTPSQMLDSVRNILNLKSDYQLAKTLGVSRQLISGIRLGDFGISTELAFKIAELTDQEPQLIVAAAEFSKAKTPEKSTFWKKWATMLTMTICLIGPGAVAAKSTASMGDSLNANIHYAQC